MWDFKLLDATRAVEKTMAYMIYRLAMYLVLSLILVFAILAGAGTGLILDSLFRTSGFFGGIGGVVGFVVFAFILYWFRGNWFYSMKAPHLVLLNESMNEAVVQHGWAQVGHARSQVRERFSTAAELHTLDKRVKAVLADLFGHCTGLGKRVSGYGDTPFSRSIGRIMEAPAMYTHEVIIAHCLKDGTCSASAAAVRALVLYAQNFNRLFKNALALLVLKYSGAFCIFLLMLAPVGWIDEFLPVDFGNWIYVFALLLTWPLKSALFDPIVLVAMVGVFADSASEQNAKMDWESKLVAQSAAFAKIKKQAEFVDGSSLLPEGSGDTEETH